MHYQYWPLAVTAPAGTLITAPVTVPWPIVQGHLKQIEVDIPGGGAGSTGIRVVYCGTVIFPWALGGWLVPVRNYYSVDWDDEIMATQLQVQMYNTDLYPHTTYWRAEVWPNVGAAPAGVASGPAPPPQQLPGFGQIAGLMSAGVGGA